MAKRLCVRAFVMKLMLVFLLAASLSFLSVPGAFPWGGHAHRLINEYAVDNLPTEMIDDGSGNAFGDMRAYLRDHSSDPDWQKGYDDIEKQRHSCHIDAKIETYPPPFDSVPRDYESYIAVFGREIGVVQWEGIRDHYSSLVELMKARNWYVAYQRAAELGHYVVDANCPLHCTVNYYGQLSEDPRNIGIHGRYESDMVELFITTVATMPNSVTYVEDRVEMGFSIVSSGWELVDDIMAADLAAQDIVGDGYFNEQYYQELFTRVGGDAQARLDLAAKNVADVWYSAWVDAGQPTFTPAAIRVNFQPIGSSAPSGWGFDGGYEYGPFGTFGWR